MAQGKSSTPFRPFGKDDALPAQSSVAETRLSRAATSACLLDQCHLDLRLLPQRGGEADLRSVVSLYSAGGSACCLRLGFLITRLPRRWVHKTGSFKALAAGYKYVVPLGKAEEVPTMEVISK